MHLRFFLKDQGLSPSEEDLDTDEVITKSLEIMGGQSWPAGLEWEAG